MPRQEWELCRVPDGLAALNELRLSCPAKRHDKASRIHKPYILKLGCCAGCLDGLAALNELRLNDCRVAALPAGLAASQRLRILDLGHNPVHRAKDLQVRSVSWLFCCNRGFSDRAHEPSAPSKGSAGEIDV